MSVIHESEAGWVVSHELFLNKIYSECIGGPLHSVESEQLEEVNEQNEELEEVPEYPHTSEKSEAKCIFAVQSTLFDIYEQFRMDSCFAKIKFNNESPANSCTQDDVIAGKNTSRKRKKKKKTIDPTRETIDQERLLQLCELDKFIENKSKDLIDHCRKAGLFEVVNPRGPTNNCEARALAKELETIGPSFADWCTMARDFVSGPPEVINLNSKECMEGKFPSVINILMRNTAPSPVMRGLVGETFLIPPASSFMMSDISALPSLLTDSDKYDLVLMDPPWPNKSVRRKRKYAEMQVDDLLAIPPLLNSRGLLVVWTTNKIMHKNFVKETLFPHWNVSHVATWYWVKVTKLGELVTDINDSHGKKPYEVIFIGKKVEPVLDDPAQMKYKNKSTEEEDSLELSTKGKDEEPLPDHSVSDIIQNSVEEKGEPCGTHNRGDDIPDKKIVMSVPSSLHSAKPPLTEILNRYLSPNPRCLELFARSLLPRWTSWGNEAIKFQNVKCYEEIKAT